VFALFRFLTGAGVGGEFAVALRCWRRSCRIAPPHTPALCRRCRQWGMCLRPCRWVSSFRATNWLGLGAVCIFLALCLRLIAVFVFWRRKSRTMGGCQAAAAKAQTTEASAGSAICHQPSVAPEYSRWAGLAVAGQIGLWGVGFYTPELITPHFLCFIQRCDGAECASVDVAFQRDCHLAIAARIKRSRSVQACRIQHPRDQSVRRRPAQPNESIPAPLRVGEQIAERPRLSGSLSLRAARLWQPPIVGSFSRRTRTRRSAQAERQENTTAPSPAQFGRPRTTTPNDTAASTFPTADSACRAPRVCGRARAGMTSASSAAPTANSPPRQRQ